MSADAATARGLRKGIRSPMGHAKLTSSVFSGLSHLRKLRECDQVAAVCYRLREHEIEFLLVRTRGSGRWTFPKGSAECGLTHAQAAALEAFEEAGVHGRIQEVAFARYVCRKRDTRKVSPNPARRELTVNAHLCEVIRLTKPKEMNRDRTWFSVKEASRRLSEGRRNDEAAEFARVLEKAAARIRELQCADDIVAGQAVRAQADDPLRKIQFEAATEARGIAWTPGFSAYRGRRLAGKLLPAGFNPTNRKTLPCEVLEFSLAGQKKPPALGSGVKPR